MFRFLVFLHLTFVVRDAALRLQIIHTSSFTSL